MPERYIEVHHNSKEFIDLNNFKPETFVLNSDNFWLYLFVMYRALYAPMRVLYLADQQVPGMEKTILLHSSERSDATQVVV
jgi:hypothetical protein